MFATLHKISVGIAAAAMLLLSSSCLDQKPASSIPPEEAMQRAEDAEQTLIGIYASLKSSALFSGLLTILPDLQADLVYAVDGYSNTYGNIWQWDLRSTTTEIESVYAALYQTISRCNFYLDCIGGVMASVTDDATLDILDGYTGEVYCIRALCYSKLIECFCKAYDPATAASTPGVVLRTKYFTPEPVRRATLADSYDRVLADLSEAERLLPEEEDAPSNVYLSLAAAYALHARVALAMRDWETAADYATKVIGNKKFALASVSKATYASSMDDFFYMWAYDAGEEIIWRLGFTTTSYGGALGTVFLNFTRDYTYYYPDFVPAAWVVNGLYGSADGRYSAYFAGAESNVVIGYDHGLSWPLLVKYWGNRNFTGINIYQVSMPKPFRLAEQYLIRAEAYCRLKRFGEANRDLTALRTQRGVSALNVTSSNWLRLLSEERVRELYMEGFRLGDLKRWGAEIADSEGYSIVRTPQSNSLAEGSSLKVRCDDPRFVWPIPQSELDAPGAEIEPNDSNN